MSTESTEAKNIIEETRISTIATAMLDKFKDQDISTHNKKMLALFLAISVKNGARNQIPSGFVEISRLTSQAPKDEKEQKEQIHNILNYAIVYMHDDIVEHICREFPTVFQETLCDSEYNLELGNGFGYLENATKLYLSKFMENDSADKQGEELQKMLSVLKILLATTRLMTTADVKLKQENEFKLLMLSAEGDALPFVKFFVNAGVNVLQHFPEKGLFNTPHADPKFSDDVWPIPILTRPTKLKTIHYLVEYCKKHHPKEFEDWKKAKFSMFANPNSESWKVNPALFVAFRCAPFEVFEYLHREGISLHVFYFIPFLVNFQGLSPNEVPHFNRKLTYSLENIFKNECEKFGIKLDEACISAIEQLVDYLAARFLACKPDDPELDLRFPMKDKASDQDFLDVNISKHLKSILTNMISELPTIISESSRENTVMIMAKAIATKIEEILYRYAVKFEAPKKVARVVEVGDGKSLRQEEPEPELTSAGAFMPHYDRERARGDAGASASAETIVSVMMRLVSE